MKRRIPHARGFTLIELMITVAIVAILAAIAYPSYREQVARSKRGDAQAALLDTAQWLERNYTLSNSYIKKPNGDTINSAALPALKATTAANYDLSFTTTPAPDDSSYTLQMVPKGSMSGDRCGTFTLKNTGEKSAALTTGCWDR
jgi:type IV pilus assembly protein PilE